MSSKIFIPFEVIGSKRLTSFSRTSEGPMYEACKNGDLNTIKYLVSHGVDIRYDDDYVVRLASKYGHLEVVKYLVEQGADIRAYDDDSVGMASKNGHLEVVKYLVSQGADIRAENDWAIRNTSD